MQGGFLDALREDPKDIATHRAYADWLMEHDEPELAELHAEFTVEAYDAAVDALTAVAEECMMELGAFLEHLDDQWSGSPNSIHFDGINTPDVLYFNAKDIWKWYGIVRFRIVGDRDYIDAGCSC